MDALVFDSVSHHYGRLRALDRLSLTVGEGEVVCLLGPSGCGKTTALRLAAGLERLQSGRIEIGGRLVADGGRDLPPEARDVGLMFQDYALFPHLRVGENVGFGLKHLPAAERERRALAALERVGMADYARAWPHTLSGGQQQRVALARALAPGPRLLLLDEPFSGLDQRLRQEVRDATLHLVKASGAATLMVTHEPEEAMFMADRIVLLRAGRLVQVGTPVECYFKPADAFAAGFFGEVNRLAARVEAGELRTPLAWLPAEGFSEGEAVEILVRPEGIRLLPPGDAAGSGKVEARVIAARLLGRSSLVHLSVEPAGAAPLHLHARVPGRFLPDDGDIFSLDLDPAQVFVFPAAGPIFREGAGRGASGEAALAAAAGAGSAATVREP
ncbi:iron(III) transport system ATP-binding protein [Tistlia consotensis]|uniref:Iron(III) transport system ATP-binding protein n=2 Tax=Tistlia TaxID=1321364 RepID=A0A1Y6BKN8_9PROT|nr:iron(III) transport system ATP-binding protein [Tistlia consotensis USBA 355]SNR49742.1 iron(III) transport system ATP-binding protein [Tistlia consotensis]